MLLVVLLHQQLFYWSYSQLKCFEMQLYTCLSGGIYLCILFLHIYIYIFIYLYLYIFLYINENHPLVNSYQYLRIISMHISRSVTWPAWTTGHPGQTTSTGRNQKTLTFIKVLSFPINDCVRLVGCSLSVCLCQIFTVIQILLS